MTVTWTLSDRYCLAIALQNDVRHQLVKRAKYENRLTDTQVTRGERSATSDPLALPGHAIGVT